MKARGEFVAKQDFVLAGWPVVVRTFHHVSEKIVVESASRDGDAVAKGNIFGNVSGPAARLLSGERVALNFLQRFLASPLSPGNLCRRSPALEQQFSIRARPHPA